jgi:hypothetical protein
MTPIMRRLAKIAGVVSLAVAAFLLLGGGLFTIKVVSREPLRSVPSTRHASLGRRACLECHAPIADEWRQSYHFKSLTGPYKDQTHHAEHGARHRARPSLPPGPSAWRRRGPPRPRDRPRRSQPRAGRGPQ